MKAFYLLPLALCTASLLYAADPFKLPDPAAVVEGKEIKAAELQAQLNVAMDHAGKKPSDISDEEKLAAARSILGKLITQKLLENHSASEKINSEDVDAKFNEAASKAPNPKAFEERLKSMNLTAETAKAQISEQMKAAKWLDEQIGGKGEVTEAEAKAYYDKNPTAFDAPETVRASHILVLVPADAPIDVVTAKRKAIDAAAARIKKGEDFAKVAKEVSEDPTTKDKGGDINFFPKAGMVPEFADAAFALKKDEVSDVVKTKFGFHIIKLTDRKAPHKIEFSDAKERLVVYLGNQKKQGLAQGVIKELLAKADIKNNLPPEELVADPASSDKAKPEASVKK